MLISALVLSTAVQAFADEGSSQQPSIPLNEETLAAFLDEFFASEVAKQLHVGAAVTVVKDGEVILSRGYGYADAEAGEPVDPAQTVFRVASVSKTFTALAIMQLVEQGKIDLDADILTYLPDLELVNPFDTPVTVANLLTHQSGLNVRDPFATDMHTDTELYVSIEDYVRQHLPPVVREPGTAYMYDNFGYLLLGLIVQHVSGMPYEEYIQEHVFNPLGMNSSGYLLQGELLERLVTGYDAAFQPLEPYVYTPTIMPHGGMLSTAEDMGKFMLAYLNGGVLESERILSEESVKEMNIYRSKIHPVLPNSTYGFEAAVQLPLAGSSDAVIIKAGDLPGNSSMLLFIPEQNVGVFLTYNMMSVLRDQFYPQFISTFFPQYAAPVEWAGAEPQSAEQLAKLAGYYRDLRLNVLISKVDVAGDGSLMISDAFLGPRVLTQVDDYLFVDQLANRYTAFTIDEATGRAYMKEPYLNPFGYAQQGVAPAGFADVGLDNVYAPYIYAMQSLGFYDNDGASLFGPEEAVTRAELVYWLLAISGLTDIQLTGEELAFSDIEGHPLAAYIQFAHDQLGMVKGDGTGRFHPDRLATRQEAAAMIWNVYQLQYPADVFTGVELAGETDVWAVDAVKMMAILGLYGPELTMTETGAVDFHSKQPLTRQEAAALYHQLMLQPVDLIVAQLMQQQQAAAADMPAVETAE